VDGELAAEEADPPLPEEDRAHRIELDDRPQQDDERREQRDQGDRDGARDERRRAGVVHQAVAALSSLCRRAFQASRRSRMERIVSPNDARCRWWRTKRSITWRAAALMPTGDRRFSSAFVTVALHRIIRQSGSVRRISVASATAHSLDPNWLSSK